MTQQHPQRAAHAVVRTRSSGTGRGGLQAAAPGLSAPERPALPLAGAPLPQTAGLRQVLSTVCTAAPPEGRAAWGSGEGAAGGLMAGPTLFLVV